MAYPDALLHRGEKVVVRKHPSGKSLVLPTVWFLLIVGGASAMIAWSQSWPDSGFTSHTPWLIGILVVAVILLIWLTIVPVIQWRTEHFVLSTAHIFFRTGILRRREHQIPLSRIQNIETVVTFWGRILGYGTLIVESAAEQPLEFDNVASISKVQSTLNQLVADDRKRHSDDGEGVPLYGGIDDPDAHVGVEIDDDERKKPRRSRRAPDPATTAMGDRLPLNEEEPVVDDRPAVPPAGGPGYPPAQQPYRQEYREPGYQQGNQDRVYPRQDYPDQGYAQPGYPPPPPGYSQGRPDQGYPQQGYSQQGYPQEGQPPPGYPQGYREPARPPSGYPDAPTARQPYPPEQYERPAPPAYPTPDEDAPGQR